MPSTAVETKTLDTILALQFTVAWLGEAPRLRWWRTDMVDEAAGGDFMKRLVPRTHRWAALEVARRAAFLADLKARSSLADPDSVLSLYFWGFELDEKLAERIRERKWRQTPPEELKPLIDISPSAQFNPSELEQALGPQSTYTVEPAGRELKGPLTSDPAEACRQLAGALLPLSDSYPAPYFRR